MVGLMPSDCAGRPIKIASSVQSVSFSIRILTGSALNTARNSMSRRAQSLGIDLSRMSRAESFCVAKQEDDWRARHSRRVKRGVKDHSWDPLKLRRDSHRLNTDCFSV